MKFLTVFLASFLLVGCGSTSSVKLGSYETTAVSFNFYDKRTENEKNGVVIASMSGMKKYSDSMIIPRPDIFVKSELQNNLNDELVLKNVELTSFEVSVYDGSKYGQITPSVNGEGLAFAVLFWPLTLGVAADAAADGVNANQIISVTIVVDINGKTFASGASNNYQGHVGNAEISQAIKKSMGELISKIKHEL